ncbi:MAG: RidA family protein [Verrucomicrobiota bacterium]
MKREEISTDQAPAAIGPYSLAVSTEGMVYTSGQIPLVPDTGELVTGGIEAQASQVLSNLKAVLESSGADFSTVVKTTVFLTDLGNFATVNALYAAAFGETKPARSTIEVSALPKGALVEIEAVALVKEA